MRGNEVDEHRNYLPASLLSLKGPVGEWLGVKSILSTPCPLTSFSRTQEGSRTKCCVDRCSCYRA